MGDVEWRATSGHRIALVKRCGLVVWGFLTVEEADEAVRAEARGEDGAAHADVCARDHYPCAPMFDVVEALVQAAVNGQLGPVERVERTGWFGAVLHLRGGQTMRLVPDQTRPIGSPRR